MIKYLFLGFSFLCVFSIAAYAAPSSSHADKHKDEIGIGLGAIIGGLIAGPPGAIVGAASGAWFGDRSETKDLEISKLENLLLEKQVDLAYLQSEIQDLKSKQGKELKRVKLDQQLLAMDKLSKGVSLTVHFRTNGSEISPTILPHIKHLAKLINNFPEIQLHLQAHADQRGKNEFNKQLSQLRAKSVRSELIRFGISPNRIHSHAHGENLSTTEEGDTEGYMFDRRVNIQLTLDTEV